MADLQKAMAHRHSRRKYVPKALEPPVAETLRASLAKLHDGGKTDIRLVVGNGDAFAGFRKSYGMFSGVRNYFVLIGNPTDMVEHERLGYYGQRLVLQATAFGLGTCWVGGTFDRTSCPVKLPAGTNIICVITVGEVPEKHSAREKLISSLVHRKSKTIEQMMVADTEPPDWFLAGMKAVQLAPSAVNRQPVTFTYRDGTVTASVQDIAGEGFALDLGIAKLHFELGAGGGVWAFGNDAEFARSV
jgi:nitroreductase